ncbi:hypothetical protein ANCCEY_07877 [Ancylostoma ceylanicum]|uniref:Protein kinase domain-containing protein n=1 Tax=Ancylostoma ceylanicum TaxID=53326 RepID=A0A0D6LP77_9BILA|nr:hypothetical protein ANCCEY_07877 [Ancylostoma ceylanicum]
MSAFSDSEIAGLKVARQSPLIILQPEFVVRAFTLNERLLVCNPNGRLDAEGALQHAYFSDFTDV